MKILNLLLLLPMALLASGEGIYYDDLEPEQIVRVGYMSNKLKSMKPQILQDVYCTTGDAYLKDKNIRHVKHTFVKVNTSSTDVGYLTTTKTFNSMTLDKHIMYENVTCHMKTYNASKDASIVLKDKEYYINNTNTLIPISGIYNNFNNSIKTFSRRLYVCKKQEKKSLYDLVTTYLHIRSCFVDVRYYLGLKILPTTPKP